jgi:hypothetical protein
MAGWPVVPSRRKLPAPAQLILAAIPQRRFPRPWRFDSIPGGYRVIDANGLALAQVYGEPPDAIAISDKRLTNNEAEKIARLIARLPELVELEEDRNKARSRRKQQPLHFKPVMVGDLISEGKLLEVHCGTAGRSATSISMPAVLAYLSACRCPRWPSISSAANAAPGTARPTIRSGPGRMPESQE